MSRDALMRVVKACRMSVRLADDTKKLLFDKTNWTIADEIGGFLCDALFEYSGEQLVAGQDFTRDSQTYKLLTANLSDDEVTDRLMAMARENEVKQPKPNFISRDEFATMVNRGYGYISEDKLE